MPVSFELGGSFGVSNGSYVRDTLTFFREGTGYTKQARGYRQFPFSSLFSLLFGVSTRYTAFNYIISPTTQPTEEDLHPGYPILERNDSVRKNERVYRAGSPSGCRRLREEQYVLFTGTPA
jgi:hypothetical protein